MNQKKKKFIKMLVGIQLCNVIIMCGMIYNLVHHVIGHNDQLMQTVALSHAEKRMRQSVDHMIDKIEVCQEEVDSQVQVRMMFVYHALQKTGIQERVIKEIFEIGNHDRYMKHMKMMVVTEKEAILYDSISKRKLNQEEMLQWKEKAGIRKQRVIKGNNVVFIFEKEQIDDMVKEDIKKQIYKTASYGNEYIWVNEILDFKGGEQYAKRVIHPNLKETEGEYLSTFTQDEVGNYPYLKELQGMKEKKEVLQTYYFKNKTNDEISEKLSYAKYYEPYHWVVATGIPLQEIFSNIKELKPYDHSMIHSILFIGFLLMFFILIGSVFLIIKWKEKPQSLWEYNQLSEWNIDPLTGMLSRRSMNEINQNPKSLEEDCLLMMIEIDDFQKLNDVYGRDVGDFVLKKVAHVISSTVGEEGKVIRYYWNTFLLMIEGIPKPQQRSLAEKILSRINHVVFDLGEVTFYVSVSMGGARKEPGKTYEEAIQQANEWLIEAKRLGKNRYCEEEEGH